MKVKDSREDNLSTIFYIIGKFYFYWDLYS